MRTRKRMCKKCVVILIVGMIFSIIMCALCACTNEEDNSVGEFYSLQAAYDAGILTQSNLKNIAYYLNGESADDDYVPSPKTPAALTKEVENAIKQTRVYGLRTRSENPEKKAGIDDVTIFGYYGTYNGCVAVRINDIYSYYPDVVREKTIADVTFVYSGASVLIWKHK